MLATWIFYLLFVAGLLLSLVGVSASRSGVARALFLTPAIYMIWLSITATHIDLVSIERGEVEHDTYFAMPFGSPMYDYQGPRSIDERDAYAVVNMSLDYTLTLHRAGATWPFGLYSLESMTVTVPPGEVGYIPNKVKGERNANAAYFRLSFERNMPE